MLRDTPLKEINEPLEQRRKIAIPFALNFVRESTSKLMRVEPKCKSYGLVYEKRVINPHDYTTRPYGYSWVRDDVDLLLSL